MIPIVKMGPIKIKRKSIYFLDSIDFPLAVFGLLDLINGLDHYLGPHRNKKNGKKYCQKGFFFFGTMAYEPSGDFFFQSPYDPC